MWRGARVFTRGWRHAQEGRPCQDYAEFIKLTAKEIKEPIFMACVADGSGSAKLSNLGAKMAVRIALRQFSSFIKFSKELNEEVLNQQLTKALLTIQEKQRKIARQYKTTPESFSTTLLFILLTPTSYFAAQVGDGAILLRGHKKEKYSLAFTPLKGKHINETYFIPLKNFNSIQSIFMKEPIDFCLLATDGIENVAFNMATWEPSEGFFKPLEDHARKMISQKDLERDLLKFLRAQKMQIKNQDDKTVLMGWKINPKNRDQG